MSVTEEFYKKLDKIIVKRGLLLWGGKDGLRNSTVLPRRSQIKDNNEHIKKNKNKLLIICCKMLTRRIFSAIIRLLKMNMVLGIISG